MSNYIGLRSGINLLIFRSETFDSLKQQALLFDRIGIFELNKCLEFDLQVTNEQLGELEWLIDQKVIYDLTLQPFELGTNKEIVAYLARAGLESYAHTQNYTALKIASGMKEKSALDDKWYEWRTTLESISLRLLALQTENLENANATPLLSRPEFIKDIPTAKRTDVFQIVINKLPLPDETTPWEQILDYRNDPETRDNLSDLRMWMRDISKENKTPHEIEEDIEYLMNQFLKHMKLHRIKARWERVEVFYKTTLDALHNVLTLEFSKLVEPLFAIKKHEISLMEAEMNAPGKEIAYIIKTNENFSRDRD